MKFKDNLNCTNCELCDWSYDNDGQKYPTGYELTFKFYGTIVTACITTDELQEDAEGAFDSVSTDGELLTSFEEVFEDNNYFKDKVKEACKKCWDDSLDSNVYDYKGLKL
jgi:hypothetical protein